MIPAHLQNRSIDQLRSTQETIRCFLVSPTGEGYESVVVIEDGQCIGGFNHHRSERVIRRFALEANDEYPREWASKGERLAKAVPYCTRCGNHEFSIEAIEKSMASGSKGRVWERVDTGERADNLNDFGPGAMWYLTWYDRKDHVCEACGVSHDKETKDQFEFIGWTEGYKHLPCGGMTVEKHLGFWHSGYGKTYQEPPLCVRTPGGDWVIDSRASNCTLPQDDNHKCWPRRGEAPLITVDKGFGPTCNAGGGSIVTGNGKYHGFLRDGFLVKC